jgi:hypothetical protein
MGRYSGMWTSCSFLFHSSVMGACWGVLRLLRKSPWPFFKWNWMVLCDTKIICECFVPGYIAMYATLASRDVVRHFLFGFFWIYPTTFSSLSCPSPFMIFSSLPPGLSPDLREWT